MDEMIKWLGAEKSRCDEERKYWAERAAREMMNMELNNAADSLVSARKYVTRSLTYGIALAKARELSAAAKVAQ